MTKVLQRLFGKPKPEPQRITYGDITPRGVKYTLVPRAFLDEVKHWDSDKYPNQIIV